MLTKSNDPQVRTQLEIVNKHVTQSWVKKQKNHIYDWEIEGDFREYNVHTDTTGNLFEI